MARISLLRSPARPNLDICARCLSRSLNKSRGTARRWIGTKYLAKVADAEKKWQENAVQIASGNKQSMFAMLQERGLIHDVTGSREDVDRMMTDHRVGAYVGIDPTAASIHVGHMLPLMALFWMYVHGYHTVTLVGGATAKIGDPTDRLTTRDDVHRNVRTKHMLNIHYQLKKLWINVEAYGLKYNYRYEWAWKRGLLNNNTWWNKLTALEFLQILGKGTRIGPMLAKETVKNKMHKGDGMSFAEFTYPLMQGWDWWHMYNRLGIRMQIGGSDQYGNITAGVDAVNYIKENHPAPDTPKKTELAPFGFTVPLLTTSAGVKFGKSAGNAIWLDEEMTSPFDLYGYFLRTSDTDVGKYLKLFTFMPLDAIEELVTSHMENPSQRIAQHKLASEFVELVHGRKKAEDSAEQHRLLFQKKPLQGQDTLDDAASPGDLVGAKALGYAQVTLNNRPKAQMKLPRSFLETKSLGKILYACGLASSASEGHRLALEQSIWVGAPPHGSSGPVGEATMGDAAVSFCKLKFWKPGEISNFIMDNSLLILRRGKHNIRVIDLVSDEEFSASGLTFPGQDREATADRDRKLALAQKEEIEEADSEKEFPSSNSVASSEPDHSFWPDEGRHGTLEYRPEDETDPASRIQRLRDQLAEDIATREEKLRRKNAPKGKFVGHGKPRLPIGAEDRRPPYPGRRAMTFDRTRYRQPAPSKTARRFRPGYYGAEDRF